MGIDALIVDDHEDTRFLMRVLLERSGAGMTVVGEASDATSALASIDEVDPQVVVLDLMMPDMSGIEAAREILRRRPHQVIVLCTSFATDEVRQAAADAGIGAVVGKERMLDVPGVVQRALGG